MGRGGGQGGVINAVIRDPVITDRTSCIVADIGEEP